MRRLVAAATATLLVVACSSGGGGSAEPTTTSGDQSSTTATGTQATDTTATTATSSPLATASVSLTEIAQLESPTAMAVRQGDDALYVAEQVGRVQVLRPAPDTDPPEYTTDDSPFLDISDDVIADGEQGLLGLAFSSDGRRLYVAFTRASDEHQEVDEFTLDGDRVDTDSLRMVLEVDDFAPNHNGGDLQFGPDGYLYYSMGDGRGAGDPRNSGQDPSDLLGDLLRIDPEAAPNDAVYTVPSDNPFADGGGAPEVWTYGLRNPWRFSFDRETGDLWIADVGQGEYEEIDFLPAADGAGRGANMGWSEREGLHVFEDGGEVDGAIDPILEYSHAGGGCAVTGGFVYRGTRIPALEGAYLWGDFCIGELNALVQTDGAVSAQRDLGANVPSLSSFGQDEAGELYALSLDGAVYRLDP